MCVCVCDELCRTCCGVIVSRSLIRQEEEVKVFPVFAGCCSSQTLNLSHTLVLKLKKDLIE